MPADVSSLIATLQSPSAPAGDRAAAAEQLARLGPDARPAAVALAQSCGDPDESLCEWANAALEELGAPAESDLPQIAELLKQQNAATAYWAATLLGRLGQEAAQATDPLGAALTQHPDSAVQERAAWALGQIGVSAAGALPQLEQAAGSDSPRLQRLARRAIDNIRGEA